MKLKNIIIGIGIVLVIASSLFVTLQIQIVNSNKGIQTVQNKIEETDIINKISSTLKKEGFQVSGMVTGAHPSLSLNIYFSQSMENNTKERIKHIVRSVAKSNGFDSPSINITYEN